MPTSARPEAPAPKAPAPEPKVTPGVQESSGAETGGHQAVPTSAKPEAPAPGPPAPEPPAAPVAPALEPPAPFAPAAEAPAPEAPAPEVPMAPAARLAGRVAKPPAVMKRPAARPASISGPTVEELKHIDRAEKRISRKVEKQDDHKAPGAVSKVRAKPKKKWESGAALRRKRRERQTAANGGAVAKSRIRALYGWGPLTGTRPHGPPKTWVVYVHLF